MTDMPWQDTRNLVFVLDDPSAVVRTTALRALVRLPIPPVEWKKADRDLVRLFCTPPEGATLEEQTVKGIPYREIINSAIFVPLPEVRDCLYRLLESEDEEVKRAVAHALTKAGDWHALPELISEIESPDSSKRVEAAECLAFHDVQWVLDPIHKAFKEETDGETRFWLALTLARQGEVRKVRLVFQEFQEGTIHFRPKYQDPRKLTERLRQLGPFPENVKNFLTTLASATGAIDRSNPEEFIRSIAYDLLYQNIRAESPPLTGPAWEYDAELVQKSSILAHHLIYPGPDDQKGLHLLITPEDAELLRYPEQGEGTLLISTLIGHLVDQHPDIAPGLKVEMGSEIIRIAHRFHAPFVPDIESLFKSYLEEYRNNHSFEGLPRQIAWLVSRAETTHILSVISSHLNAENEEERLAAAQILGDAIRYSYTTIPPDSDGSPFLCEVPVPGETEIFPPLLMKLEEVDESSVEKIPKMTQKGAEFLIDESSVEKIPKMTQKGAEFLIASSEADLSGFIPGGAEPPIHESQEKSDSSMFPVHPAPKRVVSTGFASRDVPDTPFSKKIPLKCNTEYYFWLEIGKPVKGSIETTPLDIPPVEEESLLVVAVFGFKDGIRTSPGADTGELMVLSQGRVKVVRQPLARQEMLPKSELLKTRLFFPVCTPLKTGTYQLRCNIYHKQVLLQSRLIHAVVGKRPAEGPALRSELDYTLTQTFNPAGLNQFPEHRLSILLNSNGDGTHNFYLCASDGKETVAEKLDIDPFKLHSCLEMARGTLRNASWGNENEWQEGYVYHYKDRRKDLNRLKKDLANMAQWGYEIYSLFDEEQLKKFEPIIAESGFIQIALRNSPGYYFPAAVLYDYPVRAGYKDFKLCPEFTDAFLNDRPLEDLDCFRGRCHSAKEDHGHTICPGGFWGFRHFLGMPLSLQDNEGIVSIPVHDELKISIAASEDLSLSHDHMEILEEICRESAGPSFKGTPIWNYANTYDKLFSLLKESPHIVYFYCHGGVARQEEGQDPYLVIGQKGHPEEIHQSNFKLERIVWESPKPLVFLNGCHTAAIDPLVALNFIEPLLLRSHCAGVIGTEITIFEEMATVFAEECFRNFLKGEAIGKAIRNARLKLLREGNPLGLVYIPFAIAGLKLEKVN
jgi:hypothetical protein